MTAGEVYSPLLLIGRTLIVLVYNYSLRNGLVLYDHTIEFIVNYKKSAQKA